MRVSILLSLIFVGCVSDSQPKPVGYLRLDYPLPNYIQTKGRSTFFSFEFNSLAKMKHDNRLASRLIYPEMKATLYMNYVPINKNLDSLLNDAYKMPYKHISKAEAIPEKLFINKQKKVYGTLFSIVGNAASQHQFFLTDSINHFLVGSLYFYAKPNYDSIYPAAHYLEKDITHLMESLKWK